MVVQSEKMKSEEEFKGNNGSLVEIKKEENEDYAELRMETLP